MLCAVLLARTAPIVNGVALRAAIGRPSVLSDALIGQILSSGILVNSWAKAHSGEAPHFFRFKDILNSLREGIFVPAIFGNRLESLEDRTGKPVLKQWAFEFDRLVARVGEPVDGHWEYFIDDTADREGATGQFIGKRGHVARSAYLRVLALAFDLWGVPEEPTIAEAMFAMPSDPTFLQMPPGDAPEWARPTHLSRPRSSEECQETVESASEAARAARSGEELVHLNIPIGRDKQFQADLEILSILVKGECKDPREVFRFHDWLPGHVYLKRDQHWQIEGGQLPLGGELPVTGGCVLPALIPAVSKYVGYFESDLVGRMPYLPANYSSNVKLISSPKEGGMEIKLDGVACGALRYWTWMWGATHHRVLGPHTAIAVTVSKECLSSVLSVSGYRAIKIWRISSLRRNSDYGKWEESEEYGVIAD